MAWPVCPHCAGVGLLESGGVAHCALCERTWPLADVTPCPWPVTLALTDADGSRQCVCASHAAHPSGAALVRDAL